MPGLEFEGEYPQPLVRITNLQIPMVSGFTTGRLRAAVLTSPTPGISGYAPQQCRVLLENVGANTIGVQMQETQDYVSGPRFNVGSAVTLVPKGFRYVSFTPTKQYLEFKGSTANSALRIQLESQLKWHIMAFDRSDVVYPPQLQKKFPDPSPPPAGL